MKDYLNYSAKELAQDEQFRNWVKYPDADQENAAFWQRVLNEHAHMQPVVEEARNLIHAVLSEGEILPSYRLQRGLKNRILESIGEHEQKRKHVMQRRAFIAVAASLVAIFLVVYLVPRGISVPDAENELSERVQFIKEINNSMQPKTIVLSDGTSIRLAAESELEYPSVFGEQSREIRLKGEAFFDVARDSRRPFLVYADEIVTKVLGTSFIIRAFEQEKTLRVQVKSGTVSVFANSELNQNKAGGSRLEGVILTPNQQIIFSKEEGRMVKSLVENPGLIARQSLQFRFVDTPIAEVFAAIESAYGVDVVYDAEALAECRLNASLDSLSLYDQVRLICKGIDASYEVIDSKIVVSGKGCKAW